MWRNVHPLRINGPALPSQKKVNFFKDFWVTPPASGHGTKFLTPLDYEAFFRFDLGSSLVSDLDPAALSFLRFCFFSSRFLTSLSALFCPPSTFRTASLSDSPGQASTSNSSSSLSPDWIGSGIGCVYEG